MMFKITKDTKPSSTSFSQYQVLPTKHPYDHHSSIVEPYTPYKSKQTCLPLQKQKIYLPHSQFSHTPVCPKSGEHPLLCEWHPKLPNLQKDCSRDFSKQRSWYSPISFLENTTLHFHSLSKFFVVSLL